MALLPISLYFVFRLVLRKPALAVTALLVVETLLNMGTENARLELPVAFLAAAVIAWVVTRFGLLAAISMRYFQLLLFAVPPSFDFAEWYAASRSRHDCDHLSHINILAHVMPAPRVMRRRQARRLPRLLRQSTQPDDARRER